MLKRQVIAKLYEQKQIIVDDIQEIKSEYDLREYDSEYGFFREIPYEEYPQQLKEIINDAQKYIRQIELKIAAINREYERE